MKKVIKRNGLEEDFDEEKFVNGLKNINIDENIAREICRRIYDKIPEKVKSQEIFRYTLEELKKLHKPLASKYNLKRAIYNLGPSGFPFEKYFAKILAEYGYETIINEWIDGKCLSYETDIIAIKDGRRYVIECKFHNQFGIKVDLKDVLYIFGRWIDIKENYNDLLPWIATNTKISWEGIRFAECRNIKVTAWRYPKGESLENLIEAKNLYPVTTLLSGSRKIYERLLENNYVIIIDLIRENIKEIANKTRLDERIIKSLADEAKGLILNSYS
jgi:Holliday junction resolvase